MVGGSSNSEPVPVLLVHGALRGTVGMGPTAAALRRHGMEPHLFGYRTRQETLAEHGARLETFVADRLGDRLPLARLGILTHSMGGLVARAYLARPSAQKQSRHQRLVMLAPPNQGSSLAAHNAERAWFRALYGVASRELAPQRVKGLPAPPTSCETLVLVGGRGDPRGFNPAIEGDDDGVVATHETHLPEARHETVLGVHSFLQWRAEVLDRAAAFLLESA
jgi:hypothetical protein